MKRLLFVCVENANRSQMAEAFARRHAGGVIEAYSAGSRPSGRVNPQAIRLMREKGCEMTGQRSKPLSDLPEVEFDVLVTMGCGDSCPVVHAHRRVEWDVPDPSEGSDEGFRAVRDLIERKVLELLREIAPRLTPQN